MTAPDQLVAWLRETLDTAQQRAEAAAKETASADWEYREDGRIYATSPPGFMVADVDYLDPAPGKFIATNSPAAVLRRIAADRKQYAEHLPTPDHGRFSNRYGEDCPDWCEGACHDQPKVCRSCRDYAGDPIEAPCPTVRNMAEGWGWTEETT